MVSFVTYSAAASLIFNFCLFLRICDAQKTLIAEQLSHLKPPPLNIYHNNNNQRHPQPSSATTPPLQQNPPQTSRPLERPNLSSSSSLSANNNNNNATQANNLPESPVDWLLLGADDLNAGEGKNVASFAEGPRNYTRRSGHKRKSSSSTGSKQALGSNRTTTTIFDDEQSDSSSDNEVYDDDVEGSTLAGTLKEPECASQGRYYCTYKEDYPLKLVTEVTKYYKWPLEKLFRELHAQIMPKLAQDSSGNLVCDSVTRVVRPGWARNTNDRWLVVINTENYHQYVTEVVCQYGPNSRCNFIPPCYYSSCQQRYNTQKLLVIDPNNPYRGPFLSEFLFPSCCVCYVPSTSESIQDKYRSSPATIYQRTMQQEAASNLYPPQFKPTGLLEDLPTSFIEQSSNVRSSSAPASSLSQQIGGSGSSSSSGKAASAGLAASSAAPGRVLGPGEIRRSGEQYRVQ